MRKSAELGLLMAEIPEEYGGLELDKASGMLLAEKLGASGAFATTFMAHTGIGTLPLVYYGTPEQKSRYLEKLGSGEWLAAYCLTEPDSGSDALGAKATATLSETAAVISSTARNSSLPMLPLPTCLRSLPRLTKSTSPVSWWSGPCRGYLLAPRKRSSASRGPPPGSSFWTTCGCRKKTCSARSARDTRSLSTYSMSAVSSSGPGRSAAPRSPLPPALCTPMSASSSAGASAASVPFGKNLPNLAAGMYASESVVYRLAGLIDSRIALIPKDTPNYFEEYQKAIEEYAAECAISKVYCSEVLAAVVDEVLQIHGGYGFVSEYPAERYYRDARISRIYEGTNEINRMLIPGTLLRKGMKGELPLMEAIREAAATGQPAEKAATLVHFARQGALLENLKRLLLLLAGAAVQKFQDKLANEQETLLALSDVAIQIFALESAILRAERHVYRRAIPERDSCRRSLKSVPSMRSAS